MILSLNSVLRSFTKKGSVHSSEIVRIFFSEHCIPKISQSNYNSDLIISWLFFIIKIVIEQMKDDIKEDVIKLLKRTLWHKVNF